MENFKIWWDSIPRKYKTFIIFGVIVAGVMLFGN